MSRLVLAVVAVTSSLGGCAEQPGFDTGDACVTASAARSEGGFDGDTEWPSTEDEAPAPGGPTITHAEFEYVGPSCPQVLRFRGTDAEGDLTGASVARSAIIRSGSNESTIRIVGAPNISFNGQAFEAEAGLCGTFAGGGNIRAPVAWLHVEDDAGNGSNARCLRIFAEPGVALPEGSGQGP